MLPYAVVLYHAMFSVDSDPFSGDNFFSSPERTTAAKTTSR